MRCAKKISVSIIIGILIAFPVILHAGTKLSQDIKSLITTARYKHSHWGILVSDLKSGETIYELNSDKLFGPASTTKLFSVAAGLDALGAGYRFETPVYRTGSIDSKGVMKGDLILVASGDLTMGGRTDAEGHIAYTSMDHTDAGMDGSLAAVLTRQDPLAGINNLARQVAASGIKKVHGDVIIDDRLFEISSDGKDFIRTPITVNDNLIDFVITPTTPGMAANVDWRPQTAFYTVKSRVKTVSKTEAPQIAITSGGPHGITVEGSVPAEGTPFIRVWQVKDPSSFARALLIEALKREGITINANLLGKNSSERLPAINAYTSMNRVALFKSPPYSEQIKLILKVSHNLGADETPLLVAAKNGKRTFEEGMALERGFLERAGVNVKTISFSDGEGGDRSDLVTPRAAVQLLRYMKGNRDFSAYHDALPILGVDGSLAHNVPPDSPARGKVCAKTGTIITGDLLNFRPLLLVKGLAGYMTAASGRKLVFAFYVNNVPIKELNGMIQVGNDLGTLAEIVYLAE